MSDTVRLRPRCSACHVTAHVAYDANLGKLRIELEHLDDDVHNIIPIGVDGTRGHSAILLNPDVEQQIWPWYIE